MAAEISIRVGLAIDQPAVSVPCCDGEVTADLGEGVALRPLAPVRIEPAPAAVGSSVYRLQLAALKDEQQAAGLAVRAAALAGTEADARFDPQSDLYRVRVGRYPTREAADQAGRRLAQRGVASFWVVTEGGGVREPALRLSQAGRSWTVRGRTAAFDAGPEAAIRVEGRRYRGRIEVFLNDRGTLNVVNELPLEQYLRGVVPREMGPAVFDELEALKAQAVAARTYAIANLGEFHEEGYDICATPRCQVYGGVEDEHPLSDRAVAETAGEIATWSGLPIDALYSSTCGGHTENVEIVFPLKRAAYLRGVPCLEGGVSRLAGDLEPGAGFPEGLIRRLLPPPPGPPAAALEARLRALASQVGLAVPGDRLASLERREVLRFLGSLFDLAADARLFLPREDVDYLLVEPPPEWTAAERELAAYLVKAGLLGGAGRGPLSPAEGEELLLRLALSLGAVELIEGSLLDLREGKLTLRLDGADRAFGLPGSLATFRDDGFGIVDARPLALLPGDRLRLYVTGERLHAVVQQVDPDGVAFDRTSSRASWKRFRTDRELASLVRTRYPGFELDRFELLDRGASGRVGKLRLSGADGRTIDVDGLAVRWTFDLPDTWFSARRLAPKEGAAGWQFTGRGWGHGVGLCQIGSFGMARRGHDYRAILHHYYTDIRVERWRGPARP